DTDDPQAATAAARAYTEGGGGQDVWRSFVSGAQRGVSGIAGAPKDLANAGVSLGRAGGEAAGLPRDYLDKVEGFARGLTSSPLEAAANALGGNVDQSGAGYNRLWEKLFGP